MSTCTWKSGGFLSIPSVKPPFHSGALFKDPSGGEQPVVLLHSVGRLWWNLPRKIPKEVLNLTRELFSIQRAKNEPLCFGILKTGQLFLWNVLGNEPLRWASDGLFVSPRPRKKRVGCGRPQPSEESILAVHISPDGDLVVVIDRGYVVNMYSVKRDKWICLGTVGPRGVSAVDIVFHDTPELGSVMTVCVAHSRSTLGSKLVHDEIVLDRFSDKGSSTSHTSDLLVLCTVVPSTVWEELLLAEHQSIPSGAGHSSTGVDVGTVQEMIEVPIDLFQTENASKFRICNMIPADIMATRILSMKNEASFPVIVRVSPDAKSIAVYVNDSSTSDRGVLIFLFSETRRYWEVSSGRVAGENTPSNVRMDYGPMANHVDDVRWFASPHSDGPDRFISLFSRTGTVGVSLSCYGHIFVDQDYFSNILVLDKAVFSSRIFLLDGPGDDDMFLSMSNGQERVIYGSWEVPTMKNVFRDVDLDHAWLLAFCLDKWNDPADIVVERTCKEIDNIMARVGVGDMTIGSCGKRVLEMLLHLFRHSSWDRHEHKCPPVKNPGTLFVVMHAWEKFARILEEESFVVQFYLIATCIHRFGFAIEWIRDVILGTTKNMSSSSYNLSPRVMGMMNILSSMLQTNSFSLMRFKERRKDVYLKPVLEGHHLALRGNFKEANERYRSCILSARVPPPFLRDGKSLRSTPSREEALCALWISSILGSGVHHSQDSSMVCRVDMKNVLDALNIVGDFISVHFGRFLHVEGMKESNTRRMSVLDLLTKSPTYSSAERLVLRSSVFLLLWGLASADESVGLSCTGSLCPPSLSREAMAWISLVDTDVSRMLVDSEGEGRQKSGEWIRLVHNENLRGTTEGDIFAAARSIDTLLLLHEYALAVELSLALHWSEEFLRLAEFAHQLTSRRVESVDEERIDTRGNLLEAALWMAEFVGMDEIVPKAHVQAAVLSLLLSDACEDKEKVASIFFKAHLHLRVARNVQGLLNRFIDRIHSRDDDLVRMLEDEEKMPIDPESWAMGQENAEDGIFSVYGSQTIRWIHEKSEFFLQFQDELRRFCSSSPLLQIASIVRLRAKERAQSLPGGLPGWFGDVISSVGDVDFVDEREFVDGTPSSPDGSQSDASVERQQPLQSDDVGFSHEMQECPVQIQLESISVEHAEKSARLEEEKDLERQSRHEDQTVVETAQKSLPGEWETREEEQNGVGTTEPLLRKSSEQPQHVSLSLKRVVETKVQKRSHALTDDASSGLSVGEDRDFDQDDIFPTMDEDQEVLVTQIEIADEMVKKSASASASAMREERGGTASESREGVILSKPRAKTRSEERMRSRYDDSGPRKTNVTLLSFPRSKGDQRHPIAKHVHHKPLIQLYSSPKKPEHPKQSGNESLRLMRVHGHPDATTHGKTSTGHPAFFGGPTRKRIHLLRVTKQEDRGRSLAVRPDHVKRVAVAKPIISPKSSSPVSPMSPIPHDASTLSKKTRMLVLPRQEPIRHADANVMTSTPEKQHAWSVHTQTDETERRGHSMPPRAMDPISPTHSEPKSIEFRSSFSARRSEEEWVRSVDEVVPASVISLSENAHSVGLGGDQSPPVSCEDIGIQVGSTAEDSHGEYPLAEDDDEQFVEPPLVFDLLAQPPKKTYLHIADIGELAFAKEPGSEGSGLTKRLAEVEKMVVEVQSDLSTHRHALNALEKEVDDETDERMRELPHAHVTLPPPRPPRSRVITTKGDTLLDEMEAMMQRMEHGKRGDAIQSKQKEGVRLSEDDIHFHSHGRLGGSRLSQSLEKKRKKRLLADTEKRLMD
eukprot:TRINITY_DN2642_c0_g1_i4.p1 TRINITY_DN2642_c0_g1~~TRINITY_DN2642_c0_g1_i4.p1  ORF type:complete len:1786 (-),score=507.73 TRINITY_DN2642_c0_g1_i4:79-5436(-)